MPAIDSSAHVDHADRVARDRAHAGAHAAAQRAADDHRGRRAGRDRHQHRDRKEGPQHLSASLRAGPGSVCSVATGHPQAYFDSDQVLASSPELDPGRLLDALPRGDGLRVSAVEGSAWSPPAASATSPTSSRASTVSVPVELSGLADGRRSTSRTCAPRPVDLGFLADAPPGVATRLLDAALAGPVVFSEPDEDLRLAWIAWLTYALPDGATLTFSTAGDEDARIRVADEPDAIDATKPCDLIPSLYARVAVQLAARGELRAAVARLEEPDGLALAVHGGATDLIAPHQLPLALQLITELATAGDVARGRPRRRRAPDRRRRHLPRPPRSGGDPGSSPSPTRSSTPKSPRTDRLELPTSVEETRARARRAGRRGRADRGPVRARARDEPEAEKRRRSPSRPSWRTPGPRDEVIEVPFEVARRRGSSRCRSTLGAESPRTEPCRPEPPEEPTKSRCRTWMPGRACWPSSRRRASSPTRACPCCRTSRVRGCADRSDAAGAEARSEPDAVASTSEPERRARWPAAPARAGTGGRAGGRRDDVRARDLARGVRRVAGRGARAGG